MEPVGDEQIHHQVYGGSQRMPYHGGGAISALAEDKMFGEDDEYDDLYNDVNVRQGFHQFQRSAALGPSAGMVSGAFQTQKSVAPEPRAEKQVPSKLNVYGPSYDGKYSHVELPEVNERLPAKFGPDSGVMNVSRNTGGPSTAHDAQALNLGFQGSASLAQKGGVEYVDMSSKVTTESMPLLNPNTDVQRGISQVPFNHVNADANMNRPMANDNLIRPAAENGATMLFVGELNWWTTDAEIEGAVSYYGRVKEIKFFDERASGKSKGFCQVEFYDSAAAAACKEGMDGHIFNGRACVVVFASPQAMKQMSGSHMNRSQVQTQSQQQGRRPNNDGAGRGGGTTLPGGDSGRGFGRGGWARGQGGVNRGAGNMRGRGGPIGPKNMVGNGANGGGYGPGIGGPFGGPPGPFMHPQGMMGTGFDPTFMGRGSCYGGFPGPAFPGMLPPFPNVNAMGVSGVSPHVNLAFFGRGMTPNGMGMMGNRGMDGPPPAGMWNDTNMGGGRGGEEHAQKTRESSYVGEDGGEEFGYGDPGNDKGARTNAGPCEKDRLYERDGSGNSEKRHRDERDQDRDRYDRVHRYRQEKDDYHDHRHKNRDLAYEDDWDRGQPSSRSRSRSRAMPEDYGRSRSRDADYGKRRHRSD